MQTEPAPSNDAIRQVSELIGGQGGDTPTDQPEREAPPDGARQGLPDRGRDEPEGYDEPASVEDVVEDDQETDSEDVDPVTVKSLAEKLGLEAKDIYDELEIPLGDDKSTTLGEWKDRVKALQDIDAERETVAGFRAEYEKNLMQTRQELNAMMQVIPPEMRQAVLEQSRGRASAYENEQKDLVFQAIPEWKEPDKMAADRAAIVDMGSEYGFSEQEITYTQDSRTVRMLHDYLRLRERVNAMETAAKQKPGQVKASVKGNQNRRTGRKLAQVIQGAKASKNPRTKEAAISQLIRSQK